MSEQRSIEDALCQSARDKVVANGAEGARVETAGSIGSVSLKLGFDLVEAAVDRLADRQKSGERTVDAGCTNVNTLPKRKEGPTHPVRCRSAEPDYRDRGVDQRGSSSLSPCPFRTQYATAAFLPLETRRLCATQDRSRAALKAQLQRTRRVVFEHTNDALFVGDGEGDTILVGEKVGGVDRPASRIFAEQRELVWLLLCAYWAYAQRE